MRTALGGLSPQFREELEPTSRNRSEVESTHDFATFQGTRWHGKRGAWRGARLYTDSFTIAIHEESAMITVPSHGEEAMKDLRQDSAFTSALGRPGLALLALSVCIACAGGGDGSGDEGLAGGSASGGAESTGIGAGGTSGGVPGAVGGRPANAGGTGGGSASGSGGAMGGSTAMGGGAATGSSGTSGAGNAAGGAGSTGNAAGGTGGVAAGGGGSTGTGGVAVGGNGSTDTGGNGVGGFAFGGAGAATGGTATAGAGGTEAGGSGGATGGSTDTVTRTESTFTFQHFPIETSGEGVWDGPTSQNVPPTSTTYDTVVLENGYLQVTLLPEYGGRILSIVHKPTNRELLYQNPLGTPYLMHEDIFYYDYLVILGGIFPSFPEPEHGKYWNHPYDFEVVSETAEAVTVRMSRQDDLDLAAGVPERYDVGRTDVLVELEVTLRAGSTSLELDTKLTNTRSSSVSEFEYWTVTTLAPGSPPGETAIPLDTRILAAMDRVHLLESSWSWFGSAEERVSGEVFTWNNLSHFENWVDQGTAFANPRYEANWSGLVNYENDTGILRVSGDGQTPGLKLWTFGRDSLSVDISDSDQWLRPTIEMWHGVTPEFWERGSMAAGEVRAWRDSFFPTLGLREVTAASEHGAVYLSRSASGTDSVLSALATLTLPDRAVSAVLRLDGAIVAEQEVVVAPAAPTSVTVTVPSSEIAPGAVFEAELLDGESSLLRGEIVLP